MLFPSGIYEKEEQMLLENILLEMDRYCFEQYDVIIEHSHKRLKAFHHFRFLSEIWDYYADQVIFELNDMEEGEEELDF
ncbi:hypothetical protein M1D47_21145 [Bacillus sp. R1-10]